MRYKLCYVHSNAAITKRFDQYVSRNLRIYRGRIPQKRLVIRQGSGDLCTHQCYNMGTVRYLTVLVVRQAHRILRSEGNLGWVKFIFLLTP